MNKMKFMVLFMSIAMIFGSCGSMNNTGKGAAIGGGSGAALGAILGGVIGKGKGAAIGAAVGTAVGAGTGALIGKKMDKAAAEAKQIEGAQVCQQCAQPEPGYGRVYLRVYRQPGLEEQYCCTKPAKEPELITRTCAKCVQLLVELRCFHQSDQECTGNG